MRHRGTGGAVVDSDPSRALAWSARGLDKDMGGWGDDGAGQLGDSVHAASRPVRVHSSVGRGPFLGQTFDVRGVEPGPRGVLGPMREVPIDTVDHFDAGAHVARKLEDRQARVEGKDR